MASSNVSEDTYRAWLRPHKPASEVVGHITPQMETWQLHLKQSQFAIDLRDWVHNAIRFAYHQMLLPIELSKEISIPLKNNGPSVSTKKTENVEMHMYISKFNNEYHLYVQIVNLPEDEQIDLHQALVHMVKTYILEADRLVSICMQAAMPEESSSKITFLKRFIMSKVTSGNANEVNVPFFTGNMLSLWDKKLSGNYFNLTLKLNKQNLQAYYTNSQSSSRNFLCANCNKPYARSLDDQVLGS